MNNSGENNQLSRAARRAEAKQKELETKKAAREAALTAQAHAAGPSMPLRQLTHAPAPQLYKLSPSTVPEGNLLSVLWKQIQAYMEALPATTLAVDSFAAFRHFIENTPRQRCFETLFVSPPEDKLPTYTWVQWTAEDEEFPFVPVPYGQYLWLVRTFFEKMLMHYDVVMKDASRVASPNPEKARAQGKALMDQFIQNVSASVVEIDRGIEAQRFQVERVKELWLKVLASEELLQKWKKPGVALHRDLMTLSMIGCLLHKRLKDGQYAMCYKGTILINYFILMQCSENTESVDVNEMVKQLKSEVTLDSLLPLKDQDAHLNPKHYAGVNIFHTGDGTKSFLGAIALFLEMEKKYIPLIQEVERLEAEKKRRDESRALESLHPERAMAKQKNPLKHPLAAASPTHTAAVLRLSTSPEPENVQDMLMGPGFALPVMTKPGEPGAERVEGEGLETYFYLSDDLPKDDNIYAHSRMKIAAAEAETGLVCLGENQFRTGFKINGSDDFIGLEVKHKYKQLHRNGPHRRVYCATLPCKKNNQEPVLLIVGFYDDKGSDPGEVKNLLDKRIIHLNLPTGQASPSLRHGR